MPIGNTIAKLFKKAALGWNVPAALGCVWPDLALLLMLSLCNMLTFWPIVDVEGLF